MVNFNTKTATVYRQSQTITKGSLTQSETLIGTYTVNVWTTQKPSTDGKGAVSLYTPTLTISLTNEILVNDKVIIDGIQYTCISSVLHGRLGGKINNYECVIRSTGL